MHPDELPRTGRFDVTLRRIGSADVEIVQRFFEDLSGDSHTMQAFHPHPFTREQAVATAAYDGRDYYAALLIGDEMAVYGMLRGWDAGYEIPSLGIAVSQSHRGLGLGCVMMHYLHAAARAHGAPSIRLKVYRTNVAAVGLYRRMGYVLSDLNDREWLGTFDLHVTR